MNKAILLVVLLFLGGIWGVFAATSIYNGSWDNGAPMSDYSTIGDTYIINSGTYTFSSDAQMLNLQINSGGRCIVESLAHVVIFNQLLVNGSVENAGFIIITNKLSIGGTINAAASNLNYNLTSQNSSTKSLEISTTSQILKLSDILGPNSIHKYLGSLKISNNSKFIVDKDLTLNSNLTLTTGGSLLTSNSPTLTITTIDPIDGRLILPGATLNYIPTTLSVTGTNSAIAYLNKPAMNVTLTGITDTIRNCNLKLLTINSGSKGYLTNSSSNYIKTIDVSDSLKINALPKTDSILIMATGKVKLLGAVRVSNKVDITAGGSLNSGTAFLTMLDHSDLYFATEGQISGTINIHRKYGSAGWVLFGSPFTGQNRGLVGNGGIAQQAVYMNKYVESGSNIRWVNLPAGENFVRGVGYQVGITPISNDTLIFTGTPHITDVTVSGLSFTTTNESWFDYKRGYNLVGNPFTAPISVATFFSDNAGLPAIYYWDEQGKGAGKFITRSSIGVITPDISQVTGKNQTNIQATYFAPNQGFFVKVPSDGFSVSFKSGQITRDKNNNFLKSGNATYVRLYLKNSSGSQNDCVIQFNDAGSDAFNASLDVYKLISDRFPVDIYSYKDNDIFAIQTRKPITKDLSIPIGLSITKDEAYTFSMNSFDALPADVNVFIADSVANRNVNLRDSSYTVSLKAGAININKRFKLIFTKGTGNSTAVISTNKANDLNIISEYGKVYVFFAEEQQNLKIQVIDLLGRIINEKSYNSAQGSISIDTNFEKGNIYIINLSGKGFQKSTKILVQ